MDPVRDPAPGAGNRVAIKSRARHKDLQRHVMAFGRELRQRELLSTSTEIVDALRVIETVDLADRRDVYLGTRSVFMSKPEDQPIFDEVFNNFWRRIVRRNMKYGGTIIELARKRKKIRKPRLVVICDVSRSMDTYSRFLLQFIHAMQNTIGKVESFVFSTSLTRVTEYFKNDDILEALDRIAREVHDWSGGTRIGQSLTTFNQVWAKKLLNRHTIVVILSDGLDTGDAEILRTAMEDLQEHAGKVVWLNPLLGSKDYRPLARGMSTALEHVDVFAPAHNLASLEALSKHLSA
jgi:uncharacterized protein with von Willebrand factor type A (vWA) domain